MKESSFYTDSIRLCNLKCAETHKEDQNKVRSMLACWVKFLHLSSANIFKHVNSLTSGSFVIVLQGQGRRRKRRHAKRFMGTRIPRKLNSLCGLAGSLTIGSCAALTDPQSVTCFFFSPFSCYSSQKRKTRLPFPSCPNRNLCQQSHV